jgi:virulence factor Mce-like protein
VNPRPNRGAIAGNPVLIGAATTLVVIVAVFLSYNANNGLPFVPTYDLDAQVPSAAGLIRGNDVRIGGARVGVVSSIEPLNRPAGGVGALLHLKLDHQIQHLPADSLLRIRPRSPLGLKYIEITRGHSTVRLKPGSTIPIDHASTPVDIDQFFNMFDAPTRRASTQNLDAFGTAFAGRGADLNQALGQLDSLLTHLTPAMRTLLDRRTGWAQFFPSLEQAAHEVAPVAVQQGELFAALDRTFAALDAARGSIQASISEGPASLDTATRELPAQARFVNDTTRLFAKFRPAFAHLAAASAQLAPAFARGTPALRRSPALNERLTGTLADLRAFAGDPRVLPGLARLTETATLLDPPLRYLVPGQTRCNYFSLLFKNLGSALSESDDVGSYLRFGILALPQVPGSEAGPAAVLANGPPAPKATTVDERLAASLQDDSFLHTNPYPNTAAPGQDNECEAGSETYVKGRQAIGTLPCNQNPGGYVEPTLRVVRP